MRSWRGGQNALFLGALLCATTCLVPGAQATTSAQQDLPLPSQQTLDQSASGQSARGQAAFQEGAASPRLPRARLIRPRVGLLHSVSLRGFASVTPRAPFHPAYGARRLASRSYGGISCVPYARAVSGIRIIGNAWLWWRKAAGIYARGDRPEVGSILNFRSNSRMPLGHVAVVDRLVNAREIVVEQANWPIDGIGGEIAHNITVVDVSEANNWSAVRVELGHTSRFGSVYPTYGFIYNRPDTGVISASVTLPAPEPDINPIPSDLRPKAERPWHTVEEVAQAPAAGARRLDLRVVEAAATP